jgi:hypothetical protein
MTDDRWLPLLNESRCLTTGCGRVTVTVIDLKGWKEIGQ